MLLCCFPFAISWALGQVQEGRELVVNAGLPGGCDGGQVKELGVHADFTYLGS